MPIKSFATNNNLLTYGLSSEPDPIGVSPGVATLNIVVSNTTDAPIWCDQIQVEYPVGPDAQEMTTDPGTIATVVSPPNWRQIARDPGLITFGPTEPKYAEITTDGLLFQLTGIAVNAKVGTFILGVKERSRVGEDPYSPHRNDYQVSKFPYGWFLSDFAPTTPQVEAGRPAVLSWQASSGGQLEIFYGSRPPVDVSSGPPFTSEPLAVDTVFILKASLQIGGETVEHYLTTSVTVANPALTASTLTVSGYAQLKGGVDVTHDARVAGGVSAAGLASSGGASVAGALTAGSVTAGSVESTGPAVLQSSLTARGNSVLGGTLEVGGAARLLSTLTAQGATTLNGALVNGLLQLTGRVSAFGQPSAVKPGSYVATTDGLLIGAASQGGNDSTKKSVGWVGGFSNGVDVRATGGNHVVKLWTFSTDYSSNPNSFVLPVLSGASYAANIWPGNGNEVDPTLSLWWVPIGRGATAEADEGPGYEPVPAGQEHVWENEPVDGASGEASAAGLTLLGLLDLLEELVGTQLSDEHRARILGAPPAADGADGAARE